MIVSRYIKEETDTLQADVEFITPAFLGGADGNAELRAAPFKGMLRYWWRILYSAKYKNSLQQKEAELFGSTAENGKAGGKSLVNLKVIATHIDTVLPASFNGTMITHKNSHGRKINILDYLAYGHYDYDKITHSNKYIHTAIQPGSTFSITITVPKAYSQEAFQALLAMVQYGGIGSKCRNGFGSMQLINCTKNGKENSMTIEPKLWPIHNTPVGFSALSQNIRLYKTKSSQRRWENALSAIGEVYLTIRVNLENAHHFERRSLIARPIIAKKESISDAIKNNRHPKFLLLHVAKEKDGFYGQILALPINFNYISAGDNDNYLKMVDAVYKELDSAVQSQLLQNKTAFLLGVKNYVH
ncbi:type III-B CRISPR module RAMP protein Cmr1 [Treponema vincentii]|uniref:type III-B CRISPR module RAMP protein Cmr1 n=1 Tax=Treponema vincentii TaxID=69710 RepID=UPI0035F5E6C9